MDKKIFRYKSYETYFPARSEHPKFTELGHLLAELFEIEKKVGFLALERIIFELAIGEATVRKVLMYHGLGQENEYFFDRFEESAWAILYYMAKRSRQIAEEARVTEEIRILEFNGKLVA